MSLRIESPLCLTVFLICFKPTFGFFHNFVLPWFSHVQFNFKSPFTRMSFGIIFMPESFYVDLSIVRFTPSLSDASSRCI